MDAFALTERLLDMKIQYADRTLELLNTSNQPKRKIELVISRFFEENIERKELDVLGWLSLGQFYAKIGHPDFSFSAFHMAHLLDHENIEGNSDLKLKTSAPKEGNQKETNMEELVRTLIDEDSE